MRKEKNTIEVKKIKKKGKNDKKNNTNFICYNPNFMFYGKRKTYGLKEMGNIGKNCPPKEEKTLKHIFCKEPK